MALKAGRVGVNPNYVDKEGRPLYDNSYLKELLRKEGIITLFTKEGNPISIDNAVAGRVYDLAVTMAPKQAGTGTPSPTNVRAISGYDTLKITVNSTDTDYSFDNTVYGAELDVPTGVLTDKTLYSIFDGSEDEVWGFDDANHVAYIQIPGINLYQIGVSNLFKGVITKAGAALSNLEFANAPGTTWVNIHYDEIDTLEEWKEFLSSNNLQIIFLKATPTTVQLTPAQIALVTGSNTVSSTTGTTMDLKYLGTLVPGGANGRSLNRSLNLNREVIDGEKKKEIQEEIKEEVPEEKPVTVKKSTKKSTK